MIDAHKKAQPRIAIDLRLCNVGRQNTCSADKGVERRGKNGERGWWGVIMGEEG